MGAPDGPGPLGPVVQAKWLPPFDLQRFADGERTEPATPRRRQEARRRGQVARSMDLGMAVVALAGALVLKAAAGVLIGDAGRLASEFWGGAFWQQEMTVDTLRQMGWLGLAAARGVLPVVGVLVVAGLAAQIAQVGFLTSSTPLTPQLSRLDPLAGLRRIFSLRGAFELAKSAAKAVVVGWAAWRFIQQVVTAASDLVAMQVLAGAAFVAEVAFQELLHMGLALLVVGLADYAYQRWEYEQSLRMSRHELLDELKQTEGDPHVRGRIRSRMRQLAMQRMMQRLPNASVVVTNPTHVAVALEYDEARMDAPVVVAKGQDLMASRIIDAAQKFGVPVVENPPLAWALYDAVQVGQSIPPELYRATAEVLAYVYRLRRAGRRAAGRPAWTSGTVREG
ncbi:MAG: flagellar biosynthesis protein FlhB [Bacillota bacterium]